MYLAPHFRVSLYASCARVAMVSIRSTWFRPRPAFRQSLINSSLLSLMPSAFCLSLFGTANIPPLITELPPTRPIFSRIRTLLPFSAAVIPAASPAKPEPTITTSHSSSNLTSLEFTAACAFTAPRAKAPAPTILNLTKSLLETFEFFIASPLNLC